MAQGAAVAFAAIASRAPVMASTADLTVINPFADMANAPGNSYRADQAFSTSPPASSQPLKPPRLRTLE
jgi:hypothetical protein